MKAKLPYTEVIKKEKKKHVCKDKASPKPLILIFFMDAFDISDTALSWFRSYLFDRTQVVSVNGNSSSPSVMKFGVRQGLVLGPILFVLYTQPLPDIVHHHSLSHHSFSNNNQLYKLGHIL